MKTRYAIFDTNFGEKATIIFFQSLMVPNISALRASGDIIVHVEMRS